MYDCSTIGAVQTDGSIKAMHIQHFGSDVCIGTLLLHYYRKPEQVERLLTLGNVSRMTGSTRSNVNSARAKSPTISGRCSNQNLKFRETYTFRTQEDWLKFFHDCHYAHIFDGASWSSWVNFMYDK